MCGGHWIHPHVRMVGKFWTEHHCQRRGGGGRGRSGGWVEGSVGVGQIEGAAEGGWDGRRLGMG